MAMEEEKPAGIRATEFHYIIDVGCRVNVHLSQLARPRERS